MRSRPVWVVFVPAPVPTLRKYPLPRSAIRARDQIPGGRIGRALFGRRYVVEFRGILIPFRCATPGDDKDEGTDEVQCHGRVDKQKHGGASFGGWRLHVVLSAATSCVVLRIGLLPRNLYRPTHRFADQFISARLGFAIVGHSVFNENRS